MAVTAKPKRADTDAGKAPVDVDALINRGGSVAVSEPVQASPAPLRSTATINLRIPMQVVEKIDESLDTRPVKTPRHRWLMEAVIEKLERESRSPKNADAT